MAIACVHFGLSPETFWEMRPHETDRLAHFYLKDKRSDWRKWAWFFGHLISACGNFKKPRSARTVIKELSAGHEEEPEGPSTISLKSLKDVRDFERRFGVSLLPDARSKRNPN